MIVRVFRARTKPGKEQEFEQFLRRDALPELRQREGCIDVISGRTSWGDQPEFLVLSRWESLDDLKRWWGPGDDWRKPQMAPIEVPLLDQVFLDHYEEWIA